MLTTEFARQQGAYLAGQRLAPRELAGCPVCGRPLLAGQESCTYCGDESPEAPSTWTLFRLWRFAKPYKGQLALGFILMLLGTAAHQVPPYLTAPLVDKVLIPMQSGQHVAPSTIAFYLAALLGAALLVLLSVR